MFQIQIPQNKTFQLPQKIKEATVKQKIKATAQKRPSKVKFQSIFTPFTEKFNTIQGMEHGASALAEDETETQTPKVSPPDFSQPGFGILQKF